MKSFSIVITGEVANDITDDHLRLMALSALVQIEEPMIGNPYDANNPLTFKVHNITSQVDING